MGMLLLTRRTTESIMIGDDIKITVLWIKPDCIQLGIDAPIDVPIHRKEIYDKMVEENGEATSLAKEVRAPVDAE